MEVLALLERERDKLIKKRDLIARFMASADFDKITPQNPRPENYGLELAYLTSYIEKYDDAIKQLKGKKNEAHDEAT